MSLGRKLLWILVALAGALAMGVIAASRGEPVNAVWLVVGAACIYALGYRFYSRFIATRVLELNDRRATPAERLEDGTDFVPTNKWVVFGHHFAAEKNLPRRKFSTSPNFSASIRASTAAAERRPGLAPKGRSITAQAWVNQAQNRLQAL
jgi:hypothetical protein